MHSAGLPGASLAFSASTPEENAAVCASRGAKKALSYTERNLPPLFTKRLCNIFAEELDRFPKGTGFSGGKHAPALSEASDFPFSHPLERHRICALKT